MHKLTNILLLWAIEAHPHLGAFEGMCGNTLREQKLGYLYIDAWVSLKVALGELSPQLFKPALPQTDFALWTKSVLRQGGTGTISKEGNCLQVTSEGTWLAHRQQS